MWFTEEASNQLGRILRALLFTFLLVTQAAAPPQKIAAATDSPDAEVKEF
jgi:hypothetical protein